MHPIKQQLNPSVKNHHNLQTQYKSSCCNTLEPVKADHRIFSINAVKNTKSPVATRSASLNHKYIGTYQKTRQKTYPSVTSLNSMDSSVYKQTVGSYTSLANSRDSLLDNSKIARKYLTKQQVRSANFQNYYKSVEQLNHVSANSDWNKITRTVRKKLLKYV